MEKWRSDSDFTGEMYVIQWSWADETLLSLEDKYAQFLL